MSNIMSINTPMKPLGTTQNKGNESEEIERFANYVNTIAASYKRATEEKKKGS